jgi:hypothetical protein
MLRAKSIWWTNHDLACEIHLQLVNEHCDGVKLLILALTLHDMLTALSGNAVLLLAM